MNNLEKNKKNIKYTGKFAKLFIFFRKLLKKVNKLELKKAEDKCMSVCNESTENIFNTFQKTFEEAKANHKKCLIVCTDKLNFPSEELLCYDKCEEDYNNILEFYKEKLYHEFNKMKTI